MAAFVARSPCGGIARRLDLRFRGPASFASDLATGIGEDREAARLTGSAILSLRLRQAATFRVITTTGPQNEGIPMAEILERETLDHLARDIKDILKADSGASGKQKICERLSRTLLDKAFIAKHLPPRTPGANPREVLYEDPELGFCICGHVYDGAAKGSPHDHGSSWAIYGQAEGRTEMTEWKIVEKGEGDRPSLVVPERAYTMAPGDATFYDIGVVHSPNRDEPVKLIRIEGANLDHVKRSSIKAK
jgi:predicted metal-dependent enzyme (double-stranded beta helix superfamily)